VSLEEVVAAPAAGERQVRVKFETERLLRLLGDQLYGDPRDAIREIVTNAHDAGATRVEITFREEGGRRFLVVKDNGRGMTREFLEREFCVIGRAFQHGEEDIGEFGVGRLSFLLLGDKLTIITGTGEGPASVLVWDALELDKFKVGEAPPEWKGFRGTMWIIELRPDADITPGSVREYLDHVVYLDKPEIFVEGVRAGGRVEGLPCPFSVECGGKTYSGTFYLKPPPRGRVPHLRVLEKGMLVDILSYHLPGYILFDQNVKTLSRGQTRLSPWTIARIASYALLKKAQELTPEELVGIRKWVLEAASKFSVLQPWRDEIWWKGDGFGAGRPAIAKLVWFRIGGKLVSLRDLMEAYRDKLVLEHGDELSLKAERAKEKGYFVLLVRDSDDYEAFRWVFDLKDVKDIPDEELAELVVHRLDAKQKGILETVAGFCLPVVEEALRGLVAPPSRAGGEAAPEGIVPARPKGDWARDEPLRRQPHSVGDTILEVRPREGEPTYASFRSALLGREIRVVIGRHPDPDTVAWAVGGGTIALNEANPLVRDVMKMRSRRARAVALIPVVVEEMLHHLGYKGHGEDFLRAYRQAVVRALAIAAKSIFSRKRPRQ